MYLKEGKKKQTPLVKRHIAGEWKRFSFYYYSPRHVYFILSFFPHNLLRVIILFFCDDRYIVFRNVYLFKM